MSHPHPRSIGRTGVRGRCVLIALSSNYDIFDSTSMLNPGVYSTRHPISPTEVPSSTAARAQCYVCPMQEYGTRSTSSTTRKHR